MTKTKGKGTVMESHSGKTTKADGYAPVNGLQMYHEIEGAGDPLVYIPSCHERWHRGKC